MIEAAPLSAKREPSSFSSLVNVRNRLLLMTLRRKNILRLLWKAATKGKCSSRTSNSKKLRLIQFTFALGRKCAPIISNENEHAAHQGNHHAGEDSIPNVEIP
ncbi:hypothetical protein AVEN_146418-1 [Araneus ventricosus]|uniref:Uncharacterized protein n=1 Tax=Araneus ventricosus TaxID=182803 RepID=A0A4Y2SD51_ARAVE|nr:hypothetical protein AVEN_146418-1 [Araneus ventricosus]